MCVPVEQVWVVWCARGEASNPGPQSPRRRFPSQDDGEPDALFVEPPFPSEELLDALQQDLSDNRHHRRTRRRVVLSDDDVSIPQSGPAAVVSRRVVLVPGASGDTPGSVQGRRFERGDDTDRFETPSENAGNVEESIRTPLTVPVSFGAEHAVNEAIMDTQDQVPLQRGRRRLVLVSQDDTQRAPDHDD